MGQEGSLEATSLLSEFIKSLEAKIKSAEYREIKAPFFFNFKTEYSDGLICLNKGNYYHGKEQVRMQEGSFYFIPRGQRVNFGTGPMSGKDPQQEEVWSKERFDEDFTNTISAKGNPEEKPAVISFISFDTILYNAFPFFPLLDLPAFSIPPDPELAHLMREMCLEFEERRLGREVILSNYLQEALVLLFRYIDRRPELKKPIEKLHYLTDVRLINIVKFIDENLDKELSNATIAKIAHVSDDYVGQFFKSLTGRTLQDYIENQRLDRAILLLKTIPSSVQEVAAMVGFKDAAYFSRRFRMRFKVNANAVRQGKAQLM